MSAAAVWLRRNVTLAATFAVFALLFLTASFLYRGFFSLRVFSSLFADNAFSALRRSA